MSQGRIDSCIKSVAALIATAFLVVFVWSCSGREEKAAVAEFEKIVLPVRGAEAVKRDIASSLNFSGNIDASRRVAVAPAAPGRIQRIFVDEGHTVRSGQLLARMDDYQLQQSAANLRQLQTDYERMKALKERGSTTQQAYDQIKTALESAQAGHALLRSSVELTAPYSGTIIGRNFNDGEIYNPALGSIVELAQLGKMKIEIMVSEQDLVKLRPGQDANVRVDSYPDTLFEGKVHTVNPALDRISRSSRVSIEIDNPDQLLKPGMFARVRIVTSVKENVMAVPSVAVVRRSGENVVFTVQKNQTPFTSTPTMIPVRIGTVTEEYTEIVSGIEEGVVVLTENNVSLLDNTSIEVLFIEHKVGEQEK